MKKVIFSGLSVLLCSCLCIFGVSAKSVNALATLDTESDFYLSEDQKNALEKYEQIFIDTRFIEEFELVDFSMKCKTDLNQKIAEYQFNQDDIEYITKIVNCSHDLTTIQAYLPNTRITVKNWNIYLTNKEVKKYFGNVLSLGPVAIVGALTAIGSVGGPVGSIIAFIVSSLGANYIAGVVQKAYNSNKGLKIGFGGVSVN